MKVPRGEKTSRPLTKIIITAKWADCQLPFERLF